MRALIVGPEPNLDRATIGPPVFLHHLLEGVRSHGELEVGRVLFCPRGARSPAADELALRLPEPPALSTFLAVPAHRARFQAFVRDFGPDVIDLHVPERYGLLRGLDVSAVVTIHGLVPEQLEHGLLPRFRTPIVPFYVGAWSRGIRRASAAICLSEHDAAYVGSRFGVKTHVMGVPRSAAFFQPKEEPALTALAVGALTPRKGYVDLLRASLEVRANIPGFQLRVAGGLSQSSDRAHERELRAFIDSHRLAETVRLLGQVPHLALSTELRHARVFVHLARQESLPGAVVEALASGTPVVAYDIPGTRELVRHGETGFLVRPGNVGEVARRIVELLESPALSEKMGALARESATRRFSVESVAATYAGILRDTVAAARRGSEIAPSAS